MYHNGRGPRTLSYWNRQGRFQQDYDRLVAQLSPDLEPGMLLHTYMAAAHAFFNNGDDNWVAIIENGRDELAHYEPPPDAPLEVREFMCSSETWWAWLEYFQGQNNRNVNQNWETLVAQFDTLRFTTRLFDRVGDLIVQYCLQQIAPRNWNHLPKARRTNRVEADTQYFDAQFSSLDPSERTGEYFYNSGDVSANGQVLRVYNRAVLPMIGTGSLQRNPYTRAAWTEQYRAPTQRRGRRAALEINLVPGPSSRRRRRPG